MTVQFQKSARGYVSADASLEGIKAIEYVALITDAQGRRFATATALTFSSLLKKVNKELIKAHDYENRWTTDKSREHSRVEK
jgi:hypothetical protein